MKTEAEILAYLAGYCSLAERCTADVRKKIQIAGGLTEEAENRIINRLTEEKFIDERRFCQSFVNDKLKFNRWGRIKIGYELKRKNINPEVCSDALLAIDEDVYASVLNDLLKRKIRSANVRSAQDVFRKLYRFAVARGFEPPLIIKSLKELYGNADVEDFYE
jgi:regulatory protein